VAFSHEDCHKTELGARDEESKSQRRRPKEYEVSRRQYKKLRGDSDTPGTYVLYYALAPLGKGGSRLHLAHTLVHVILPTCYNIGSWTSFRGSNFDSCLSDRF
jgi:hypothetical protein